MYKKRIVAIVLAGFFSVLSFSSIADEPGDPGGDPQVGSDPPLGGGAPIGSGTLLLIGLGVAYGGYKLQKKNDNETSDTKI